MKKQTILCLLFLSISIPFFAQENNTPKLSNLYSKAAGYPKVQARLTTVEINALEHEITKRKIWPSLDVQAQNTYGTYKGLAGAVFPLAGNYNVSGLENSGTAVNALISGTLKWDVIQFGKHKDQVEIAQIQKEKSEVVYELEDLELKKEITQTYINWMYAEFMRQWVNNEIKRHSDLLRIANAKAISGQDSAADSLLVKSQYRQAKADEKKWVAQSRKAENKIEEFTGVHLSGYESPETFQEISSQNPLSDVSENHPELTIKYREQDQLKAESKHINHQVLPDISVLASGMFRGAGYSGEDQWGASYKLPVSNYLVGLGLSWKLDRFYDKKLKSKKNLKEQDRVGQEKESIKKSLDEETNSLTFQLEQARDEIEEIQISYEAAKRSYDLFKTRYENGIIDLTTLHQIEQSLQISERNLLKAYYQYWQYWKDYAYLNNDYSILTQAFN